MEAYIALKFRENKFSYLGATCEPHSVRDQCPGCLLTLLFEGNRQGVTIWEWDNKLGIIIFVAFNDKDKIATA